MIGVKSLLCCPAPKVVTEAFFEQPTVTGQEGPQDVNSPDGKPDEASGTPAIDRRTALKRIALTTLGTAAGMFFAMKPREARAGYGVSGDYIDDGGYGVSGDYTDSGGYGDRGHYTDHGHYSDR